ncbi:MAG TPA: 50S ribosomal protein L10 [Thermodesulfobacteriaceae bacterium]|nr:50S ribosomal protein L10 [Thermodesulfobacteriaceae bacterium]
MNLPLTLDEKKALVEELHDKLSRSVMVILTKFPGLDVESANKLRSNLRDAGGEWKVSKNTLLKRAAEGTLAEILIDKFEGPNAIAISYDDPVGVAKVLVDFAKENEILEIRGGMLNGKPIDPEGVEALAKLPGREVLIAKMLSVLAAAPNKLVQVLAAVPRKLVYALQAIEEQKK